VRAVITTGILFGFIVSAQVRNTRLPRFEDYPTAVYAGKVKPPRLGDPAQYEGTDLRCFGGDAPDYSAEPVNFAGHFVIGTCTCGTGCHYLFMWDARTGKLYRNFPFDPIDVGPFSDEQAAPIEYAGETFRANSRLLIIDGCREDTCDCGVKYYLWNGTVFQMLRKRVSRIPPSCKK
jgi:hypothetical protein